MPGKPGRSRLSIFSRAAFSSACVAESATVTRQIPFPDWARFQVIPAPCLRSNDRWKGRTRLRTCLWRLNRTIDSTFSMSSDFERRRASPTGLSFIIGGENTRRLNRGMSISGACRGSGRSAGRRSWLVAPVSIRLNLMTLRILPNLSQWSLLLVGRTAVATSRLGLSFSGFGLRRFRTLSDRPRFRRFG